MSMEMDFLRRSARFSRLEKIRNNVVREKMNIKYSVLDYIRYKQLKLYGLVQGMDKYRLPRRIIGMVPTWKRKKGKTYKFLDAGGYKRNERAGNWRLRMA
jgi:hypothetical protein